MSSKKRSEVAMGSERMAARVRRELARLGAVELRTVRLVHAIGGRPVDLARLLGVSERTIREILRRPKPSE